MGMPEPDIAPPPHFRMREIYAFIATDPADDSEGIVGAPSPSGGVMPLIAADKARLESLKPFARDAARATGMPIKVARFSIRKDIEIIDP